MFFLVNWLLVCLCLISITGCVGRAKPDTRDLVFDEDATLPNLTLSRHVVPEVGTAKRIFYGESDYVQVESKSRFGDSDEEPDLSCIYAGLREILPSIDIIPTTTFWEQVEAPQNVIQLPELFAAPESGGLRALQADVLVIAYHARIDVEYDMVEGVVAGGYSDLDRETAAVVVVDLNRKTIIHGSKISFEDWDVFFHTLFIVPFGLFTLSPSDICITVAEQAGQVIALKMPDRKIKALVVVAAEDPFTAAKDQYDVIRYGSKRAAEWEKLKQLQEEELQQLASEDELQQLAPDELIRQAKHGNANAQLILFKDIHTKKPNEALIWLCRSATLGNREARVILAEIYEHGGNSWIKKGIAERNYKLAYVWYALSRIYDQEVLQFFADLYLTSEERLDAEKMLKEWQPGNCERELGLDGDDVSNLN